METIKIVVPAAIILSYKQTFITLGIHNSVEVVRVPFEFKILRWVLYT